MRRIKNTILWLRLSAASFLAFFVLSVIFHPTSYVVGYYRNYALAASLFGGVNVQVASWLAIAVFCVWMAGWSFLWYGRNKLSKAHAKVVNVVSWVIPAAIAYAWIAAAATTIIGMSITYSAVVAFVPPLLIGCAVPLLFIWRLQNSDEKALSSFTFLAGLFLVGAWIGTSLVWHVLSTLVEILLPVYFGLLSVTYLLTLLRITQR